LGVGGNVLVKKKVVEKYVEQCKRSGTWKSLCRRICD